jgi:hypothetical protein
MIYRAQSYLEQHLYRSIVFNDENPGHVPAFISKSRSG